MMSTASQSGVSVDQTEEAKVFRISSIKEIWNTFKDSNTGKQTKRCIDASCATTVKIIQGVKGYLNRHHHIDYAVKIMAIFILCGVALECLYLLRLVYWMVVKLVISIICLFCSCVYAILSFVLQFLTRFTNGIFTLIRYFFVILWAVVKFLVYWFSGVTIIVLLGGWALRESKKVPISKQNNVKQQSHSSTGYCWQFKDSDSSQLQWSNFGPSDNVAIEKLYCEVENLQVTMVCKDTRFPSSGVNFFSPVVTIDFEQMCMQSHTTNYSLHRNASYTKWIWYWEDNDGWKKYTETKSDFEMEVEINDDAEARQRFESSLPENWVLCSSKTHTGRLYYYNSVTGESRWEHPLLPDSDAPQSSGTKQEEIEAAYLNNQRQHCFRVGTSNYKIRFHTPSMYQRNMDLHLLTKRSVRRRPLFVFESTLQTTQSDLTMTVDISSERIPLPRDSEDFKNVSEAFHRTIPERNASILTVEKIKNGILLERYNRKRKIMKKVLKVSDDDEIEKLLFHGTTPDVIDAICKQNFDHRMRGKNGTVYGEGSYFAVNASYSNNYSNQSGEKTRFMFLALVLTGEYTRGERDLRRPPLKDPNNPASDLYDSCVDNELDPKIFVIFNDEQCYPLCLIKYRLS